MGRFNRNAPDLNFPLTCPAIDGCLETVKQIIESQIESLLDECETETKPYNIIHQRHSGMLYDAIADEIEEIRRTNSDMRNAANSQLSEMYDEIESLYEEINELKSKT